MNVTDDFHVIILTFILALRTAFSSEFYFSIHKTLFYSLPTEAGRERLLLVLTIHILSEQRTLDAVAIALKILLA